jgi:sugar lactone lactonase YvrE
MKGMKRMARKLEPELIYYAENTLLEGPLWDDKNNLLYFISIDDNMIYQFNEETKEITSYPTNGPVGAAILNKEGKIISAEKTGIYSIDPDTKERTFLMQPSQDKRMRYNDGKMDPKGRYLFGTMGYEETIEGAASLYVIENDEYRELLSGLTLSNGMGWSKDGETFYHIDTPTKQVKEYNYNLETAELSNARTVIEIPGDGSPDGMCVDIDEKIWIAEFGGKRICKWDPETGEKLVEIPMPVTDITSCYIGGREKDYLYITTARSEEPLSGGLFRVKIR